MILGTLVFWVDVNTVVASYNVKAYQSGKLETMDVEYLGYLGYSATPWLIELADDNDPEIAQRAAEVLENHARFGRYRFDGIDDFRNWNFLEVRSQELLREYDETR
jgi:hypothetical protein